MNTSPDDALDILQRHFSEVTPEQFVARLDEHFVSMAMARSAADIGISQTSEPPFVLPKTRPSPLNLNAYVAAAGTGLNDEQRQVALCLSALISKVCGRHGIDPGETEEADGSNVFNIDRPRVLVSDLIVYLNHFLVTGTGKRWGLEFSPLVPVIVLTHSDTSPNSNPTEDFLLKIDLVYEGPADLERQLDDCLLQLRPVLEQRKLAFSNYGANIVGNKIRMLREELGLTRADVVKAIPGLTAERLQYLEESSDRVSNPELLLLRQIATVLNTTVADLVEPDLGETLVAFLKNWATRRVPGGFFTINERDRKRTLRRILLRIIDSLDD